ncbi:hypothetical protein ACROYT_G023172 [Oculina patagonica]
MPKIKHNFILKALPQVLMYTDVITFSHTFIYFISFFWPGRVGGRYIDRQECGPPIADDTKTFYNFFCFFFFFRSLKSSAMLKTLSCPSFLQVTAVLQVALRSLRLPGSLKHFPHWLY